MSIPAYLDKYPNVMWAKECKIGASLRGTRKEGCNSTVDSTVDSWLAGGARLNSTVFHGAPGDVDPTQGEIICILIQMSCGPKSTRLVRLAWDSKKSIQKERQLQFQLQLNVHDSASPTAVQKRQRKKVSTKDHFFAILHTFCRDDHGESWLLFLLLLVVVVLILLLPTMEY